MFGLYILRVSVCVMTPVGIVQFLPLFGRMVCVPVQSTIGNRPISGHSEGTVVANELDVSGSYGSSERASVL